jgi:hypothetical protein
VKEREKERKRKVKEKKDNENEKGREREKERKALKNHQRNHLQDNIHKEKEETKRIIHATQPIVTPTTKP